MQNSQSSDPTVAKLLEIDATLAVQEAELTHQLQSIHEKRHSLQNVIGLFSPVDTVSPTPVVTPTPVVEQAESPVQAVATPELDEAITPTTLLPPPKRQSKKNSSPSKKSSPLKQTLEAGDTWQKYLREEFSNASLPVIVSEVMQQQPEQVLEITAILNTLFVDEIPKDVKSKARERVSNVLSVGAKKGKWYRGVAGKYSMSKAATAANAAG